MKTQNDSLLTIAGVAELLSVSRPQVYRLLNAGLPSFRLHPGGDRRFDKADVLGWVESRKADSEGARQVAS